MDRFNAELGDELTGQNTARTIIAKLEQANLFLIPLDDERHWYRYHHLFAEFLRSELARTDLIDLQHRAALWFAGNGMSEEGIKYALGRWEEALHAMEEAVNFTAVEGYERPFLGEGPEVRELLLTVESKKTGVNNHSSSILYPSL